MSRRLSAANAAKLISEWIENDDKDEDNVEFDDSSDVSELDNVEIDDDCEDSDVDSDLLSDADGGLVTDDVLFDNTDNQGGSFLFSKDSKTKWDTAEPRLQKKRSPADIVRKPAQRAPGIEPETPSDAFQLFFEDSILECILKATQREAQVVYAERGPTVQHVVFTLQELKAFIGLLILIGVTKGRNESLDQLWSNEWGRPIFRASMSKERFKEFLRFLRFDDKDTRQERRITDKLAAIREIFDHIATSCKAHYEMSEYVAVDEMLSGFRGKCPFRVYIPSKPAKYGMKIWVVSDCTTAYCGYMQAYLGKVGNTVEKGQGARVVKDLCQHLYGSGRNITMDNFFTQYTLAQELLQNKLTIIGTLRKNNAVIPRQMLADRKREVQSTLFGFNGQTTIASYVPKKNRCVVMLSTLHHDKTINPQMENKPDIILDYNVTKGAVDTLDKLCCQYSTKRGTRRWPLSMFFTLLDISVHNSSVIWLDKYPDWSSYPRSRRSDVRRLFILKLGKSLCIPWIETRKVTPTIALQPSVKRALEYVKGKPVKKAKRDTQQMSSCKGRCHKCSRQKDNKTSIRCHMCSNFVCGKHATKRYLCVDDCRLDDCADS